MSERGASKASGTTGTSTTRLIERLRAAVADALARTDAPDAPAVVAVSGGLDSVVLLHVLRFFTSDHGRLVVAHFDHRMREGSEADAQWVAGLAAAWGLSVEIGRAKHALRSEAEARRVRYDFLQEVCARLGDSGRKATLLTAHHADDQAETVLFRALRGTGITGLAGIPARRDNVARPFLAFWRDELEAYAHATRLSWREDPTNRSERYARNALRARILPDIEALVAPGARRALVRIAELAREEEAGWASILPGVMASVDLTEHAGMVSMDRDALASLHPAVRARILRALARRFGISLDELATRRAVEFVASASSGRALELGAGVVVLRELDRVVLGAAAAERLDRPLLIPGPEPGAGSALLAGHGVAVRWGGPEAVAGMRSSAFDPDRLRFPLSVRARVPGDRIRLAGGTKRVKKLLLERRVPRAARSAVPLVVDAEGEVIWIPGIARSTAVPGSPGDMNIGIA